MNQINYVDVCFGLSYGDEGKGKIVSYLSKNKDYDFVCRWNGGHNAGHTIYKNGIKYKTHLIPSGIFYNIKSIIGPNCVLNIEKFLSEIDYLKNNGFNTSLIKVSPKCQIITNKHLQETESTSTSTSTGIAPAYRDKYARIGLLARDVAELKEYMFDENLYGNILCEGAQGFYLDINYGNYPYVTSSHTLPYDACSLGFSPKLIRNIYGACKIYDTRAGYDPEFPANLLEDSSLSKLIELGEEYGTTTGRKRITNWLNLDKLINAIKISGTTDVYISKTDIMKKLGVYKLYISNELKTFRDFDTMKQFIVSNIMKNTEVKNIVFSGHKENL